MNLVTGASGLVGSHLVLGLLSRGESVRALVRPNSDREWLRKLFEREGKTDLFHRIDWAEGDVLDVSSLQDAMAGCHRVFHTAAVVSYHRKDRSMMYKVNVEGTANVVNVALEFGSVQLCHISSIAALGRTDEKTPITEDTPWADNERVTHYGRTKYLSEMEVWRGLQEGLQALVVNPGLVIGPGDFSRSSSSMFTQLNKGIPFYPPGGTGFIGVRDLSDATIELMALGLWGKRFIAVSDNLAMRQVFDSICRTLGKRMPERPASRVMMWLALIAESLKELFTGKKALVTREVLHNMHKQFHYDSDRLINATGIRWRPLEEEIERTAAYFRNAQP